MQCELQLLIFLKGSKEASSLFWALVFNLMTGEEKKGAEEKTENSVMHHNKATLTSL